MNLSNWCFPECKACKEMGLCTRAVTISAQEIVREKAIRRHVIPEIKLPCGHWGLEWPLVHVLGENFAEVFCDKCSKWMKVTRKDRDGMKKEAQKIYRNTGRVKLPLEPPF